jgi:hypothetical protein
MLCDSESFRADTLYQISCPSSETRNLALLRDILDGVLLKSQTSENLEKMKIEITLVKYLTESLKVVDICFDKKKKKRFLLSFTEHDQNAYISIFQFFDTESICEDLILILRQEMLRPNPRTVSPLNTVQERPYEEDQSSLSYSNSNRILIIPKQKGNSLELNAAEGNLNSYNQANMPVSGAKDSLKASIATNYTDTKTSGASLESAGKLQWKGKTLGSMMLTLRVKKSQTKLSKVVNLISLLSSDILN